MLDFVTISTRSTKRGVIEIYPKFIVRTSNDLMIRGGDFYAIWVDERGLWSTNEEDALQLIDRELDRYAEEHRQSFDANIHILHLWDAESGMIDAWLGVPRRLAALYLCFGEEICFDGGDWGGIHLDSLHRPV